MGGWKCKHAYYRGVIIFEFLAVLLVLSVLGYFNAFVEGKSSLKTSSIFNTSTRTIDGITRDNANASFSFSFKMSTRNKIDNFKENNHMTLNNNTNKVSTSTMDGKIDGNTNASSIINARLTTSNKTNNYSNTSITFNNSTNNNLPMDENNNFTLCRCMPNSECWPSLDAWNLLNGSMGGVLVKPSPPASPCYEGSNQNATACQIAATNWGNPFWRADQVGAMQYVNREAHGNQTCSLLSSPYFTSSAQYPLTSRPSSASGNTSFPPPNLAANAFPPSSSSSFLQCQQGAIPFYAVEVLDASHVQAAVVFAAQNKLRLSIKSTGHDVLGRSTAPGSLNLWMHRMRNITFYDRFIPDGCDASATFSAVTAESGTQWAELYAAAHARNLVVVGSMSGSVSTGGGFVQGGGHSPLSPFLGLAADNVIEMKVVTADGRTLTANACQNQDLFWALRGGGGGTFGIVLSCTHITYPALDNIVNVHFTATSDNATLFEELLTQFVYLQSSLSQENYWAGYSYIVSSPTLSLAFNYLAPNCNTSVAQSSFASILNFTTQHSDKITTNVSVNEFPSFRSWHSEVLCSANPGVCSDSSGFGAALASRLLPHNVLHDQPSQVAQAFMEILANGVEEIVGHLVGGQVVSTGRSLAERERARLDELDQRSQGVFVADLQNGTRSESAEYEPSEPNIATSSVNPAWRRAPWHVLLTNYWGEQESPSVEKVGKVTQMNGLLRELSPGSGCYLNEADVNEPNWQQAFFGDNYDRLKSIKKSVDPEGLFTCTKCVGSEDWTVNDELICRRPSAS